MMGDELLAKWHELSKLDANMALRELFSQGILSRERVEMAASLGSPVAQFYLGVAAANYSDEAARAYLKNRPSLPEHNYRKKIEIALGPLEVDEKLRFAYECAARVQEFWTQEVPTDETVPAAISLIENYLNGTVYSLEDIAELGQRLQTASDTFDDPDKQEIYRFPKLIAAHQAISSVVCAIGAVEIAEEIRLSQGTSELEDLDENCSYAANHAVDAKTVHAHNNYRTMAADEQWLVEKAEEAWQVQRLFNYLLKRLTIPPPGSSPSDSP